MPFSGASLQLVPGQAGLTDKTSTPWSVNQTTLARPLTGRNRRNGCLLDSPFLTFRPVRGRARVVVAIELTRAQP